jgi:hypothetical protein
VHVQDGIVTISGRVNTYAQRKAVERAVKRVAGIKTLIVRIAASLTPLEGWKTSHLARMNAHKGNFSSGTWVGSTPGREYTHPTVGGLPLVDKGLPLISVSEVPVENP